MRYQEVPVVLRFVQGEPITLEDVRAYLRGQGQVFPAEVCYGELRETPEASWTVQHQTMAAMGRVLDSVLSKVA